MCQMENKLVAARGRILELEEHLQEAAHAGSDGEILQTHNSSLDNEFARLRGQHAALELQVKASLHGC